jgi:hypothetical protein
MAASILPPQSNFLDADLHRSQKRLLGSSPVLIARNAPSKPAAQPNGPLPNRSPGVNANFESSRTPATLTRHKTHETAEIEELPKQSQRRPSVTDKMGPGRSKARPRGESDLGRHAPKIKLFTSNGSTFGSIAESTSPSGYEYHQSCLFTLCDAYSS